MRPRTLSGRYARTAYLFLLPAILFFAAFFYLPIGNVVATSFRTGPMADQWTGLGNYAQAVADPAVRHSFLVTAGFSVMVVAGSIVLGLALALAIDQPLRGGSCSGWCCSCRT
ncbi:carbohydrate ABC transporter permease [Nonomuraea rubra]|uniref:carbohydrate ABC transporter permease n=1 Tax=Nonomuraea rubra TaxID=46180 RepID=UPI00360C8001